MKLLKHSRGLTLVELMTTASVAALTLTLGVPSLQHALTGVQRGQAATELSASMLLARSEAVRRGVPVTVCPSGDGVACTADGPPDWSTGWILFADRNGDSAFDGGQDDRIQHVQFAHGAFSLTAQPPIARGVRFSASGLPDATGRYRYCDETQSRELALSTLGRIDLVDTGPGCP